MEICEMKPFRFYRNCICIESSMYEDYYDTQSKKEQVLKTTVTLELLEITDVIKNTLFFFQSPVCSRKVPTNLYPESD